MRKSLTIISAIVLSVLLFAVSVFALGCNNNDTVNNDNAPTTNNTENVGGSSAQDADTETVVAAANKTYNLFKVNNNYTFTGPSSSTGEEGTYNETLVIKCDGTKIHVLAYSNDDTQSAIPTQEVYFSSDTTQSGTKFFMYLSQSGLCFKKEITETEFKTMYRVDIATSEILPLMKDSKWIKSAESDTYSSTIRVNGADEKCTIKLTDGFITEIKFETSFYKISNIGTTTVTLPENAITIPNVA